MASLAERFAAVARPLEDVLANGLVERVLTSPLHPIFSWHLLLVSYEGRSSATRYTTPVLYWEYGDHLVATTPAAETNWWKNFRTPYSCRLRLRGEWRDATGRVDDDPAHVRAHLDHAVRTFRRLSLGHWPPDDALDDLAAELVLVRFELDD